MPVEERLRSTLADQAATVRADVEGPLEQVHRRRRRRVTAWSVGGAAAVVALVAGVAVVVAPEPERPVPLAPPGKQNDAPAAPILPSGTYTRQVGVDEARAAGFARGEVRHLFDGGEEVTVVMAFLEKRDPQTGLTGWRVWFVDEDGGRRIRDGGGYFNADGEVTVVSKSINCLGCNYHFTWELRRGRLVLDATTDTQPRPMTRLLEDGAWQRR